MLSGGEFSVWAPAEGARYAPGTERAALGASQVGRVEGAAVTTGLDVQPARTELTSCDVTDWRRYCRLGNIQPTY